MAQRSLAPSRRRRVQENVELIVSPETPHLPGFSFLSYVVTGDDFFLRKNLLLGWLRVLSDDPGYWWVFEDRRIDFKAATWKALLERNSKENSEDLAHLDYPGSYRDLALGASASTYQHCPLRYYYRYVIGLPEETASTALVFGGAIHPAVEHYFRELLAGGEGPRKKCFSSTDQGVGPMNTIIVRACVAHARRHALRRG